jgi:hypothetical protein
MSNCCGDPCPRGPTNPYVMLGPIGITADAVIPRTSSDNEEDDGLDEARHSMTDFYVMSKREGVTGINLI